MFINTGGNIKLGIVATGFYLLLCVTSVAAGMSMEKLVIARKGIGPLTLAVEVANTPQSRSAGLMERQKLAAMTGMIFDFGKSQLVTMWMKNTFVSLDMIFIDRSGIIQQIERRTMPHSTDLISSKMPVRAVLEVAAGFIDDHNIKLGDRIIHDIFPANR